ncbi:MAG: hemolysin secretion protein [Hyphomicrobiales bacterium]|jgi:membrane fusion protein (multidrug efflux system)|nr:hemolysin secretion protein [Hyphomicrobiales bacterium]
MSVTEIRRPDPIADKAAPGAPVPLNRAAGLDESAAQKAAPVATAPRKSNRLRYMLMGGGVIAVALASGGFWLQGGRYVSTDNAYVRAAKLMVSTDVSGIVQDVAVKQGQRVKAGDILFRLQPDQFRIAVDNARAQLEGVKLTLEAAVKDYDRLQSDIEGQRAQAQLAQSNYDRASILVRENNTTRAAFDQTRAQLTATQKALESLQQQREVALVRLGNRADLPPEQHPQYMQAKAALDEAQRQLDHTIIRAPFAGTVTAVDTLQPGTFLVSQTASLTTVGAIGLVSESDVWVEANLKETDLNYTKSGDSVEFTVDAYPGRVWHGRVQSINPATGGEFSILPAQNSSGNWVKVVQRVPVRISIERSPDDPALRAGMSVNVDVDTGHERKLSDIFGGVSTAHAAPQARENADKHN